MERHGLGRLADAYYGRGSTALRHAGEYLQARIERTGGFAAMMEGWDGVTVLDQTDGVILQALMSMFYFDFDYESGELPFDTPLDVVELQQPQYEADPFSVINPWMVVYLDRYGWIPMLSRLMHEELALRCPAVNPRL